jgi:LacI family transcriptional regulator
VDEDEFSPLYANSFTALSKKLVAVNASLLFYVAKNIQEIAPLEEATMGHGVDGIFVSGKMNFKIIEKLQALEVPTLVLGHLMHRDPLENQLDQIIVDSLDYSYRCTKMLIEKGAKNIALVNGPSYQIFSDSTQGYMKALNEHGIKFDEKKVIACEMDDALIAEDKFSQWLDKNEINAVFAASENLQLGVKQALWNSKDKDIIIASISYGSLKSSPSCLLLTISADQMASEAIELMGKKLANLKKAPETIKILANA